MHVGVVDIAAAVVGGAVFFAFAVVIVVIGVVAVGLIITVFVGDVAVGLITTVVVVVVADVIAIDNFRRRCETCLTSHTLNERDYVRRRRRRMRIMMGGRCVDIVVMSV